MWELAFWASAGLLVYTYLGYGAVLWLLLQLTSRSRRRRETTSATDAELPEVTLLVAAYNESDWIEKKIANSLAQDYPSAKLHLLFVTDGSDDGTPQLVRRHPRVRLLHRPERRGKIAAVTRAMGEVETPIVVFTDANSLLNPAAVRRIVRCFADPAVGAVAGEKRIETRRDDGASGSGEGLYWKYESTLKRWDSQFHSVVGAAGELFAIRTALYEPVPHDTIIEDFYMTLRIAQRGHVVRYEPEAYAIEAPSASVAEELKRKVRIAAGGLQAIVRLRGLLNPWHDPRLTFQYVSHRVLRWTLAPLALLVLLVSHVSLAWTGPGFYTALLPLHVAFYVAAWTGWLLDRRHRRVRSLVVPYYFCMMNLAVYLGAWRWISGTQSVLWERARRAR